MSSSLFLTSTNFIAIIASVAGVCVILIVVVVCLLNRSKVNDDSLAADSQMSEYGIIPTASIAYGDSSLAALE